MGTDSMRIQIQSINLARKEVKGSLRRAKFLNVQPIVTWLLCFHFVVFSSYTSIYVPLHLSIKIKRQKYWCPWKVIAVDFLDFFRLKDITISSALGPNSSFDSDLNF